ncbi:MAG: Nramp family divalent metal transporter [Rubrobacter sp.]
MEAVALLAANLGLVDYTSRLSADALRVGPLAGSGFWSEGRIYAATVWGLVVFGCLVLLFTSVGPGDLILVSAALSVFAMSVYCALLIYLNRKALPNAIKLTGLRLGAMIWATLLFASLTLLLLLDASSRLLATLTGGG